MKQKEFIFTTPSLSIDLSFVVRIISKILGFYKIPFSLICNLKSKMIGVFKEALYFLETQKNNFSSFSRNNSRIFGEKFNFPKEKASKILKIFSAILILAVIIFGISRMIPDSSKVTQNSKNQPEVKGANASMFIGKEFEFPLTDSKGREISKIKYLVENAELRDEIIIKGQRATSVKGRTFLIITLKITNNYEKTVNINTRDYVRLSVNDSPELLAPDIHNDPVEVQAISTKYTRVGFPINTSDTNLVLQVGEINKEKEIIELSF